MNFSNFLSPSTAIEWDRWMMTPVSNESVEQGLEYFRIHSFVFYEGTDYSRVGDYSGYHPIKGKVETWLAIMDAWENRYAPFFPEWSGRGDMFVVSNARLKTPRGEKITSNDIVRTNQFSPYRSGPLGIDVNWEKFRENTQLKIEEMNRGPLDFFLEQIDRNIYLSQAQKILEKEEFRKEHIENCRKNMPRIGDMPSVEEMSHSGFRLQSLAFVRDIDATISHQLADEVHTVPVLKAKLVVWLETQLLGEELAWRWLGAVYSWKSVSLMALDRCDMQTHTNVTRHVEPLVRRWVHLLREATQPPVVENSHGVAPESQQSPSQSSGISDAESSAPPPFRNNMEV